MAHDDAECLVDDARAVQLCAVEQPGRSAAQGLHRSDRPRRCSSSTPSCPRESNQPYDIKDVIHAVVDDAYFFEVQEHYAKNIVVGFARLNGQPVGIVANQPAFLAGVLDIKRQHQRRALRALLRLLQYSADYV